MPRNVAGPVVRHDDFWGRKQEIELLWRMLERGDVLLQAPRRHGKSSLMRALADLPQPGWRVVHLDVEYIRSGEEFATVVAASLLADTTVRQGLIRRAGATLRGWFDTVGAIEAKVPTVGDLRIELRDAMPNADWKVLAEGLLVGSVAPGQDTLLILDELPMMVENMLEVSEDVGLEFLRWFRAQRQSPGCPTFLVGGSLNLEPLLYELGQTALLNDLQRFRLRGFAPKRAAEFVRSVLTDENCTFEEGVPDQVVYIVDSGVPFFLQVVIDELRAIRARAPIRVADVEPTYRGRVLAAENRHRFSHYETRLRQYGEDETPARWVLEQLAGGPVSVDQLDSGVRAAGGAIARVLARLEADYYVHIEEGSVSFESVFLRDWWTRNASRSRR